MVAIPRLMLVTDRRRARGRDLVDVVGSAFDGGVRLVQLREKDLSDDAQRDLVRRLRARCGRDLRVVVNGPPRVAWTAGDGLHLPGAAEFPPRREGSLLGRSVHAVEEVRAALAARCDYLVVGTVFETASKRGRPPAGPDLVRRVVGAAAGTPVFAIGGITVSNAARVLHAGAYGVAVCGAILASSSPRRAAEALSLAVSVAAGDGR